VTQKQRPTLNTLLPPIREKTNFKGGKISLRKMLKKPGFNYLKNTLSKQIGFTFLSKNFCIILPQTFLLDGRKLETTDK
jgi:hypothetical protein